MPSGTFLPPGLTTSDVKITSGGTNNYVMTAVDSENIQGEANLQFDGSDLTLAADVGIVFGDAGEKIEGDGTDLTITGNAINLTASEGVYLGLAAKDIQTNFRTLFIDQMSLNVDGTGAGSGAYMGNNVYRDDGDDQWEYIINDEASQYVQYDGNHQFRVTATAGSADGQITWTNALTIASSGKVGIGVDPDTNLHVYAGDSTATARGEARLIIEDNAAAELNFMTPNNVTAGITFGDPQSAYAAYIHYQHSNGRYSFGVEATEQARWADGSFEFIKATELNMYGAGSSITNVGASGNDWTVNQISINVATDGGYNTLYINNSSASANSRARIVLQAPATGGASDAFIYYAITSGEDITNGLDNSDSDNLVWSNNGNLGTSNRMKLVPSTGVLSVDGDGGGSDDPVSLFDAYDDAIELKRYAHATLDIPDITPEQRLANRERLVDMGVAEWAMQKEGPDHLMIRMQPMTKLLAGGIYQTRERMDNQYDEIDKRLARIEEALGV